MKGLIILTAILALTTANPGYLGGYGSLGTYGIAAPVALAPVKAAPVLLAAPVLASAELKGPETAGLVLAGPKSTGAIVTGPQETGAIVTGPSATGSVLTSGGSTGAVLTEGLGYGKVINEVPSPILYEAPKPIIAAPAPILYSAGKITEGGGTIGVSAHGAVVNGPPTAPVLIKGPSGKVEADGLWGPTLQGLEPKIQPVVEYAKIEALPLLKN